VWRNGVPTIVSQTNFPQSSTTSVSAINDNGSFVGRFTETFTGPTYAALWSSDFTLTRLPAASNGFSVTAQDINGSGQVAGHYSTPASNPGTSGFLHGFVSSNGRFTDISPLPNLGHNHLLLFGITSDGTAAGFSGVTPAPALSTGSGSRAVRWRYGVTEDLNKLLPANTPSPFTLLQGTAASGPGHIAGTGLRGEASQGFLLTPQGGTGGANVGVN
jgi:uncharacterized membrane protein